MYNIFVNEDFQWIVHETKTDHVVAKFFFVEDAEDYAAFLESGGGFSGWTPEFMLRKVRSEYDLNHEFENLFL